PGAPARGDRAPAPPRADRDSRRLRVRPGTRPLRRGAAQAQAQPARHAGPGRTHQRRHPRRDLAAAGAPEAPRRLSDPFLRQRSRHAIGFAPKPARGSTREPARQADVVTRAKSPSAHNPAAPPRARWATRHNPRADPMTVPALVPLPRREANLPTSSMSPALRAGAG